MAGLVPGSGKTWQVSTAISSRLDHGMIVQKKKSAVKITTMGEKGKNTFCQKTRLNRRLEDSAGLGLAEEEIVGNSRLRGWFLHEILRQQVNKDHSVALPAADVVVASRSIGRIADIAVTVEIEGPYAELVVSIVQEELQFAQSVVLGNPGRGK